MSFTDNNSIDLDSNIIDSQVPSVPKHRPLRKAHTVDSTVGRPLSKLETKSADVMQEAFDNDVPIPPVPLHRPVRRTTTDEIDSLIKDTNEELKQMENILTKHAHIHHSNISQTQDCTHKSPSAMFSSDVVTDSKEMVESPVVPQRPRSKKSSLESHLSNDLQLIHGGATGTVKDLETVNTSPLNTPVTNTGLKIDDHSKNGSELPQVPSRRPTKRKSSPDSDTLPITNPFLNNDKKCNTTTSVNIPILPKQRPTRIKKLVQDNNEDVALTGENLTKKLSETEHNLISTHSIDTRELGNGNDVRDGTQSPDLKGNQSPNKIDSVVIETDSEINKRKERATGDNAKEIGKVVDNNGNTVVGDKAAEDIIDIKSKTKSSNNVEISNLLSQDIFHDDEKVKSSDIEEEHKSVEENTNEETEVEPLENPTPERVSSSVSTSERNDKNFDLMINKQNENVESNLKSYLERDDEIKDNQEPLLERENINITENHLKIEEKNVDSTVDVNKDTSSNDSSSELSASKAIPQAPLSRPQKKGPPPVPKKLSSKIAAFHEILQKQQMKDLETKGKKTVLSEKTEKPPSKNMNFINNLNNLISIPNMVPPSTTSIPVSNHDDRLQDSSTVVPHDNSELNKLTPKKELQDVRQRRARGPRGRKLPSKVNDITKIVVKNENYVVQVRPLWSLKCVAKNSTVSIIGKHSPIETENEAQDNQQNNTSDMEIQSATDESLTEENLDMNVINNASSENHLDSTVSPTDSVLSRDDECDGVILEMEKDFETTAEKEMQEQFIKDDGQLASSIGNTHSVNLGTAEVDNLKQVVTDITVKDSISLDSN